MSDDIKTMRHQQAWLLLPWYFNGSLPALEHESVRRHVQGCLLCRRELDDLASIAAANKVELSCQNQERSFARLMTRVDREADRISTFGRLAGVLKNRIPDRKRWRSLFSPVGAMSAIIVGQLCVIAFLLVLLPEPARQMPDAEPYRTLSAERPATPAEGLRIRLVFSDDAREKALREILHSVGARIVDGPSPKGVYTAEIAGAPEPPPADRLLSDLRRRPEVLFAEKMLQVEGGD